MTDRKVIQSYINNALYNKIDKYLKAFILPPSTSTLIARAVEEYMDNHPPKDNSLND